MCGFFFVRESTINVTDRQTDRIAVARRLAITFFDKGRKRLGKQSIIINNLTMSSYGRVVLRWTAAATQRSLITGRSFAARPATRLLLPVGVSGAVRHNVVHLLLARLTRTGGANDSRRVSPSIYLYRDYRKRIFFTRFAFPDRPVRSADRPCGIRFCAGGRTGSQSRLRCAES